jgi:hypothetical protein
MLVSQRKGSISGGGGSYVSFEGEMTSYKITIAIMHIDRLCGLVARVLPDFLKKKKKL